MKTTSSMSSIGGLIHGMCLLLHIKFFRISLCALSAHIPYTYTLILHLIVLQSDSTTFCNLSSKHIVDLSPF